MQLAAVLAPFLFRRMAGNPRRLKRFLNAYWLCTAIAVRRNAALEEAALAKLLVLEELDVEGFSQLLAWLGDGELSERLAELEDATKAEGGPSTLPDSTRTAPPLSRSGLRRAA